ncbi:MAG TPA: photosynthetic reaction center subunit H [Paracoccaceae bacterium]|nr:photosynthetic reaction center subunit H [Paracoccaceae bacterium]
MDITSTITGYFDVAQLTLYLFWIFFFGLIFWIQRENMREGFPLVSERTGEELPAATIPLPDPKTFRLPHGGGELTVPGPNQGDTRPVAAERTGHDDSFPLVPTGDPMKDGVGPAAWCERADKPDLTYHGDAKIVPMRVDENWVVAGGSKDIRGRAVISGDDRQVGTVKDLWVDRSESMIRYIEIELEDGSTRLAPFTLCYVNWWKPTVTIRSLHAHNFEGVPTTANPEQVTLLEEDKISAYYCGGLLYASKSREEPQL